MRRSSCISQPVGPTPCPLGKPQQVIVLVQQGFVFALCKEATITRDTKHHPRSEVSCWHASSSSAAAVAALGRAVLEQGR